MSTTTIEIEKPDFEFKHLKTKNINGKRHYVTTEGQEYISITSLLGYFSAKSIAEWRRKVGEEEANRISNESSSNGTAMHNSLEVYLQGGDYQKTIKNEWQQNQFDCVKTHLDHYFDEMWWQEIPLYSNRLGVAGRVDLIGIYKGVPTVIDFKTSKKFKKKEWVQGYLEQATFYAMSFYEMTKFPIKDIVILVSVDGGAELQVFQEKVGNYMNSLHSKVKEYKALNY